MDEQGATSIEEQAAGWFVTMRGPQAEQEKARFEAWLERDARHREAYARIGGIFENARVLRASGQYGLSRKRGAFITVRKAFAPVAIAASVAILAVIGLATPGLAPWPSDQSRPEAITLETPPRTIRTFALPGGGALVLDRSSKAVVHLGDPGPRILLLAGRMQLKAMGSAESVTIAAGANTIATRSGVLDVALDDHEGTSVRLYSGYAQVHPHFQSAAYVVEGRSLQIGHPLYLIRGNIIQARDGFVVNERDWPSGWAQYRAVPLSRLVSIANRYAETPIVLDDPAIGAQTVSGRFRFNDASSLARNLATIFDLEVTERNDGLHLQRR